jgi:Protein of unknown function (DUF3828)
MWARVLLFFGLALPAAAQPADPAGFVAALYRPYLAARHEAGPLGSESGIRATFSPALAALLIRDQRGAARRGEVGCVDADPFVAGQDYQLSGLQVRIEQRGAQAAAVRASFRNFGRPTRLRYRLIRAGDGWRIDDIQGRDSLRARLRACLK